MVMFTVRNKSRMAGPIGSKVNSQPQRPLVPHDQTELNIREFAAITGLPYEKAIRLARRHSKKLGYEWESDEYRATIQLRCIRFWWRTEFPDSPMVDFELRLIQYQKEKSEKKRRRKAQIIQLVDRTKLIMKRNIGHRRRKTT